MADISSVLTTTATIGNAIGGLVLVTPTSTQGYQPLNKPTSLGSPSILPRPSTLLFHYEGEQVCDVESDITDHYVEDNTAIQDQIALKPETYTTNGFIGELNNVIPANFLPLQSIISGLTTIQAYTPGLSTSALLAYDQALLLYEQAKSAEISAVGAWSTISSFVTGGSRAEVGIGTGTFQVGNGLQNLQQKMFQQLYGYWNTRTLFDIQTPWAIFTNMAILRLKAVQDAETKLITDFQITFKKIRTASTQTSILGGIADGRAATQASSATNLGTSSGSPAGSSLGTNISKVQ